MNRKKGIVIAVLCLLFVSVFVADLVIPEQSIVISSAEAASKVKLNKKKLTMTVGESFKLTLKGAKGKIKWTSSNKKVVSVSSKGKLKAKKAGKATIVAQVGGKKYKCKVTVKKAPQPTPEKPHGFKTEDGKTFFYDEDGNKVKGARKIENDWYFFSPETGEMLKGNPNDPQDAVLYYDEESGLIIYNGELSENGKYNICSGFGYSSDDKREVTLEGEKQTAEYVSVEFSKDGKVWLYMSHGGHGDGYVEKEYTWSRQGDTIVITTGKDDKIEMTQHQNPSGNHPFAFTLTINGQQFALVLEEGGNG